TTVRAGEIAPVPAEEHPDVHLIFLLFEPAEETPDSPVIDAVAAFSTVDRIRRALHDELLLFIGQLGPRHIEPDPRPARGALQLGELCTVVRLAPRLDGVLRD